MPAKYRISTKADIELYLYEKSIRIGTDVLFNGETFSRSHIQILKKILNLAFEAGRKDKAREFLSVLKI